MAKEGEPQSIFAGLPDNLPKGDQGPPKVVLPEQLQGKSPEEIYSIMNKAHHEEVTSAVDKTKAGFADELRKQQQQGNPSDQGQQQQQVQRQAQPGQQQFGPFVPGQQQQQQDEQGRFLSEEDFMQSQFDKRMTPYLNATVSAMKEGNKTTFKSGLGEGEWEKYGDEIEKMVGGLAPQIQMHPSAWTIGYNYVRSLHLDDITKAKATEMSSQQLTKVFKSMGLSPDKVRELVDGGAPAQQQAAQPPTSLFQGNVGVPVVESSSPPAGGVGATDLKKRSVKTSDQKAVMEAFEMTDKEYDDYALLNTDILSAIEKGETK